ncbi:hypothetical protein [Moorena producens]
MFKHCKTCSLVISLAAAVFASYFEMPTKTSGNVLVARKLFARTVT